MKRKNIYLILLSCLLWLSFSVLYSFSESNGGGTGSGGSSNHAGGGGWKTEMSGYRFTIVDRNFNAVKINGNTSIDILYSVPKDVPEKYKNSRVAQGGEFTLDLESGENEEYVWKKITQSMKMDADKFEVPHYPMDVVVENDKKEARTYGKEFYDWMLSRERGDSKNEITREFHV